MPKIGGIFRFKENHFSAKIASEQTIDANLEIIADANLTNRTELSNQFGVLSFDLNKLSDSQLILEGYKKFGESCVNYLVGDFVFAIWDKLNKKLFCVRDHFGANPFFYFQDKDKFIFASEPKDIFKLDKEIPRKFNHQKLATFLLPEPHTYLTEQSWFESIKSFPAGTALTITSKGIKENRYWKPKAKEIFRNRSDEEISEEFRSLLFDVIKSRIKDNLTPLSLLSGGLDSSSITAVMAKILEKENRDLKVFAGVLEDNNDPKFTDERSFIDHFQNFPNVNIKYVSAAGKGPFSDLESYFEKYDSPVITSRQYLYRAFFENAEKIGAETIYDGSFGEAGATFHGVGGFAEMFSSLRWLRLRRELTLRNKFYGDSVKYNFRANTINPLLPTFLVNLKNKNDNITETNHFLNQGLANNLLNCIDLEPFQSKRIAPNSQDNQINEMAFIQKKLADFPTLRLGHGITEIRYPFLDKRLIEFTQSIPLHLKIKDGYNRYLIRATLDQILPPEIQWRTTKTPFSPDYVRRYNSQIESVKNLLDDINNNDPIREILDIEKIKSWASLPVADTERYTIGEILAREKIPQAVYLIYFLRTFSEFRK